MQSRVSQASCECVDNPCWESIAIRTTLFSTITLAFPALLLKTASVILASNIVTSLNLICASLNVSLSNFIFKNHFTEEKCTNATSYLDRQTHGDQWCIEIAAFFADYNPWCPYVQLPTRKKRAVLEHTAESSPFSYCWMLFQPDSTAAATHAVTKTATDRVKVNQSTCMVQTTLKRSGMDHTAFNLQRTPCLPLPRCLSVHQMAPPLKVVANI